jgi:hypothetical protein
MLIIGSDEEEENISGNEDIQIPKDLIWENHFEDNEKLTTVTVIEDFQQDGLENAEGLSKPQISQDKQEPSVTTQVKKTEASTSEKKKKKAFRYGTKAERQADRRKAKLKKRNYKSHKRN